jgi:hypothetical protein
MKREKRLTKRERKALAPAKPTAAAAPRGGHIHCIACGRHIEPEEFQSADALMLRCQHGSTFPSCADCRQQSTQLLAEHDRTGQAVRTASAWH